MIVSGWIALWFAPVLVALVGFAVFVVFVGIAGAIADLWK